MSNYQADWLVDDEGNALDEGDEDESDGDNSDISQDESDEEIGDGMEPASFQGLGSMPPPVGLPKSYFRDLDDQDGDDITLDGSILTANLPTKKELQVRHQKWMIVIALGETGERC